MEQTYTIARIIKETPVQGKYGMQVRTAFTTNEEGDQKVLSAFSNNSLKAGQQVTGTVTEKPQPDGRTFYNFNFVRKSPTAGPANLEPLLIKLEQTRKEIYAIREEIVMLRQLLQKEGRVPSPQPNGAQGISPYPQATNIATAFDNDPLAGEFEEEFDPADIPFD